MLPSVGCRAARGYTDVVTLHRYVGFGATDNLDEILSGTGLPAEYDFLSVDIDGNDYHVWQATTNYRPRVVCIEFNPTIPTEVSYVQAADPSVSRGASLLALVELGREKNYELVCVAGVNAFFVSAEYYPLFRISDNSPASLRTDLGNITYLFSGYDGTILLEGCRKLPWHGLQIRPRKIQVLPAFLRRYPGNYNPVQLVLYGAWLLAANPRLFRTRFGRFVRGRLSPPPPPAGVTGPRHCRPAYPLPCGGTRQRVGPCHRCLQTVQFPEPGSVLRQ